MSLISLIDGTFSVAHILYIFLNLLWFIGGAILVKKKAHTEKTLNWIIKISGILLLIVVTIMRISQTIRESHEYANVQWYFVFPASFCSFCSYVLGISVLCCKKDSPVYHFIIYMAFYGAGLSTIYPDYLNEIAFFSVEGLTSLLHHLMQLWIIILLVTNQYIIPKYKRVIYYIIGFLCMVLVGVFEIYVLKYPHAMNVNTPLLTDLPYLTTWYSLLIAGSIVTTGIITGCKLFKKRKLED